MESKEIPLTIESIEEAIQEIEDVKIEGPDDYLIILNP